MEAPGELLLHLVQVLEDLEIPYAVAGSVAAIAYGEPRATRDIDVVVDLTAADLGRLKDRFPEGEFYLDEDAAREAVSRRGQFNIIHPSSGFRLDLFVAGDRIEHRQVARARELPAIGERTARFSPPEELILKKLQYYAAGASDRHLRDIGAMLQVSGDIIDRSLVEREAEALGLGELWRRVQREASAG